MKKSFIFIAFFVAVSVPSVIFWMNKAHAKTDTPNTVPLVADSDEWTCSDGSGFCEWTCPVCGTTTQHEGRGEFLGGKFHCPQCNFYYNGKVYE